MTEDATTADPRTWEFQGSWSTLAARRRWDHDWKLESRAFTRNRTYSHEVSYGIRDRLDLAVGSGYTDLLDRSPSCIRPTGSGWTDTDLLPKWTFYEQGRFHLAFLPGATIPTGSTDSAKSLGTGQGYWSVNPELALTRGRERWTSNAALLWTVPVGRKRGGARTMVELDVAAGWQAKDWLQPEAEVNLQHDWTTPGSDSGAATLGFILPFTEHLRGMAGIQQTLWGRNVDRQTNVVVAITPVVGP